MREHDPRLGGGRREGRGGCGRRRERLAAPPDGVPHEPRGEREAVDHIAAEQPARLLAQPVQPFEPEADHPVRRALGGAADEVQAGPDAQEPGVRERVAHLLDQQLLLGEAQGDEDDVRLGRHQPRPDVRELVRVLVEPERWRVATSDAKPRIELAHALLGRAARRRLGAQQVDRPPVQRGLRRQRPDQVRPRDSRGQRATHHAAGPDQRHAVGDHQVRIRERLRQLGPARELAQVVEVGGDDAAALTPVEGVDDRGDRVGLADRVDLHAHQLDARPAGRHGGHSPLLPSTCGIVRSRILTSSHSDQLARYR